MTHFRLIAIMAACFSVSLSAQEVVPPAERNAGEALPMLRDASLLVGTSPFFLMVTNQRESLRLQPEQYQPQTGDSSPIYASFSRDGNVIAYARLKSSQEHRVVTISTYSKASGKKEAYAEGEYSGAVSVSPDASKIAFLAAGRVNVIDRPTRARTLGPDASTFATWSPDSRRIAYTHLGEIRVWDIETGSTSRVAQGDAPAWSPSGEWIAYLQPSPNEGLSKALGQTIYRPFRWLPRCMLVHPDGTGSRALIELKRPRKGSRFFEAPPVWSPDSKMVLLNEVSDVDAWTMDIHIANLDTGKTRVLFRHSMPVLGWAAAK